MRRVWLRAGALVAHADTLAPLAQVVPPYSINVFAATALAAGLRRQIPNLATIFVANAGTRECEGVLVRPFTCDALLEALATRTATDTRSLTSAS